MEQMIEVTGLVKKFGDFTAVDNISFSVSKGEIFGLLGENGAGKTTTLGCWQLCCAHRQAMLCSRGMTPRKSLKK